MDQEMGVLVTLGKRAELCLLEEEGSLVQEDWEAAFLTCVVSLMTVLAEPAFVLLKMIYS